MRQRTTTRRRAGAAGVGARRGGHRRSRHDRGRRRAAPIPGGAPAWLAETVTMVVAGGLKESKKKKKARADEGIEGGEGEGEDVCTFFSFVGE